MPVQLWKGLCLSYYEQLEIEIKFIFFLKVFLLIVATCSDTLRQFLWNQTSPCVCLSLSQIPSLQLLHVGSFAWTASCIRELACSCCLFGCSLTQAGAVWFDNLKLWERSVKINWASTKKARPGFRALVLWCWAVQPAEGQGCGSSSTRELCCISGAKVKIDYSNLWRQNNGGCQGNLGSWLWVNAEYEIST